MSDTKPAEPATTTATEEDDEVEQSRAPLLSHIVELRGRLMKSIVFILIAFVGCFAISKQIYNLLILPYEWAAGSNAEIEFIFTAPQEFLITRIKLAFFGALYLAFPIIATQLYKFVAPGPLQEGTKGVFAVPDRNADPVPDRLGDRLFRHHAPGDGLLPRHGTDRRGRRGGDHACCRGSANISA